MDLVLFGIQGSGKGTQAKKLAAEHGFEIFEAGAELRKIAASGSDLGKTVKEHIDAGHLVPHEIIMLVVKNAICAKPKETTIIFDGVPRDENQMNDFNVIMQGCGRDFRCVHFLLDAEAGVQRIVGRAKLEGRVDDQNEETIRKRMNTFLAKTMPVIEAYKAQGKVTEIQADGAVEQVYADLEKLVH